VPPSDISEKGQLWMRDFKPFQVGSIDLDYYKECRSNFTTEEWIDLIISSMGFNPTIYTDIQKNVLITRILPLVEPRINLVELAPKGTGKSFVYGNVSRYGRVIGGGKISPAVMFHHNGTNTPGIVTRYDAVILDEVQSVRGDSAGFVMLGNITLDENYQPVYQDEGIFNEIPNFLQETAFIDRLHGIIPGWLMPRVSKDTPSTFLGFKGDFFSEVLHVLRSEPQFTDYVNLNMRLKDCNDLRDKKAIVRLATAYLKVIFPDLIISNEEFIHYCVKPAVELRQRVRDELHKMDSEYAKVDIKVIENNL
jgi:ATP-dependent Lon protease